MHSVPALPESAPFTPEQRAWLNGFLAGVFSRQAASSSSPSGSPTASAAVTPLTIAWGSQTGTAEGVAKRAAKEASKRGFAPTLVDLAQLSPAQLAQEKALLLITSTFGDGEPPDNAKALWEALRAETAPALPATLRYAVLGLGDTNYTQFCQCAKDFDAGLERCGATRVAARVDCDLEYEAAFAGWLDNALKALSAGNPTAVSPASATSAATTPASTEATGYSRKNPFPARLVSSENLNGAGSAKAVHHVVFALANSGLAYEAGDALGVVPCNCPELVTEILARLGRDGEEAVPTPEGGSEPLRLALTRAYDLGRPTAELLKAAPLPVTVGVGAENAAPHDVLDVLRGCPEWRPEPAVFVGLLRKLQPRLYSISSSPKAHPGEVHLTVGVVKYETRGVARKGVCSTFLAERAVPGTTEVGVFVHANRAFRPPADPQRPMIMVGPGTGIAPFRAFLEERAASGAKGRNWLFFGDQRQASDFLYRSQLEEWLQSGVLTRLDTAFSRDQAEKIYVQQRMRENGAELFRWLEEGAHFYVCGDASRMAKDVDAALHEVIATHGGRSADQAAAYVQQLKADKRYARDVY